MMNPETYTEALTDGELIAYLVELARQREEVDEVLASSACLYAARIESESSADNDAIAYGSC